MAKKNYSLFTDSVLNLMVMHVDSLVGPLPEEDYISAVRMASTGQAEYDNKVPHSMLTAEGFESLKSYPSIVDTIRILAGGAEVVPCEKSDAQYIVYVRSFAATFHNAPIVIHDPRKRKDIPKGSYPLPLYFKVKHD